MNQNKKDVHFKVKIGGPSVFADVMKLYHRNDGICILLFGSSIPVVNDKNEASVEIHEQARIVVTEEHVKRIIDVLCHNLKYYPEKK